MRLAAARILWKRDMQEDDKDPSIWFLDHSYHEAMFTMFKKINAKEVVVGWYSTGPKLREADLGIHELVAGYASVPSPCLVIVDVQVRTSLDSQCVITQDSFLRRARACLRDSALFKSRLFLSVHDLKSDVFLSAYKCHVLHLTSSSPKL